ncbi:peptidylprolyl isomerase [Paenibacillus qinlingensis]|uniref:peptidylprolyl isomerase n=1 Tax=Paenibacillus qinlingensis TaxID=1837343 RepID=UPI0015633AA8|nr:peptidyl-prolyl cis-trans isomerase [Paenibacillus qinlingensis]NQX58443.1 peptidyl-prolyl cis-trans isomerase [Paenibacillus qinlingensis]
MTMKKARNSRLAIGLWCFIVILAGILLTGSIQLIREDSSNAASVASVNGEVVEAREFSVFLVAERAKILAYFQHTYGAEESPEFWTTSYQGEIPLDKITKEVLRKMMMLKVQQSLGIQYGHLQNASYTAFLEQLRIENERRTKDARAGKPIYGPKQLDAKVYYEMRQSQLLEDLKRKMNSSATIKETEIKTYYDANQRDFVKAGMSKVNMISIPYSVTNEGTSKLGAEQQLEDVIKKLEAGKDFKTVTDMYCENQPAIYRCKEQVFDAKSARMDVMTGPAIALAAKGLHYGEISGVIEERQTLNVLQCVEKQADVLLPLDEVSKGIAQKLGDQAFDRFLQDKVSQAELIVNDEALNSVAAKVLLEK